jgi:hypothetical protein
MDSIKLLEKQYQIFKQFEFEWLYKYLFVILEQQHSNPDVVTELYDNVLSSIKTNIIDSDNAITTEPNLILPILEDLKSMFNMSVYNGMIFVKRFYSDVYNELLGTTIEEGRVIMTNLMNNGTRPNDE